MNCKKAPAPPLLDAHCHYQDAEIQAHWTEVSSALQAEKVEGAVVNGTREGDWEAVERLAHNHAWIIPSFAVHPWHAGNRSPTWAKQLKQLLAKFPHAGIGEAGLDRWMLEAAKTDDVRLQGCRRAGLEEQSEVLRRQISLAAAENRPLTLHCLHAWNDLLELLRNVALPKRGFLLHAYGGTAQALPAFLELGAYVSFNGSFLSETQRRKIEPFRDAPADRILVETDAPAMPLPPAQRRFTWKHSASGRTINHPANLSVTYQALAKCRGIAGEELAAQVAQNFSRFFGWSH